MKPETGDFPCLHPRAPSNTLTDAGKARCRTCRNKTFREAKARARKREKAILGVFPEVVEALERTQSQLDFLRMAIEASDPQAELLARVTDIWKQNDAVLSRAATGNG